MSSTQLAKKIVTIGIYRYLTIYRATQFTSIDILETVNCKYSQKMNDCSDLFLKCQVLILIHLQDVKYYIRLQNMSSGREPRATLQHQYDKQSSYHSQENLNLYKISKKPINSTILFLSQQNCVFSLAKIQCVWSTRGANAGQTVRKLN